jgi:DNA-binding MarR family transcriptional regulator
MSDDHHLGLDDQLCFALYAATHAVLRAYRPHLRRIGLTYPQYLVMLALWRDGPLAPDRLVARLGMTPAALARALDRLESSDFVFRLRAWDDGRVTCVAPTQAGADLEQAAAQAQANVRCSAGLSPDACAELRDRLRVLSAALES